VHDGKEQGQSQKHPKMSSNFDLFGPDIEISLDESDPDEETRNDDDDDDDDDDDHRTDHAELSRRPLKPLLADARPDWRALQVRSINKDASTHTAQQTAREREREREEEKGEFFLNFFAFSPCS
jgi:hypothetical protein